MNIAAQETEKMIFEKVLLVLGHCTSKLIVVVE